MIPSIIVYHGAAISSLILPLCTLFLRRDAALWKRRKACFDPPATCSRRSPDMRNRLAHSGEKCWYICWYKYFCSIYYRLFSIIYIINSTPARAPSSPSLTPSLTPRFQSIRAHGRTGAPSRAPRAAPRGREALAQAPGSLIYGRAGAPGSTPPNRLRDSSTR